MEQLYKVVVPSHWILLTKTVGPVLWLYSAFELSSLELVAFRILHHQTIWIINITKLKLIMFAPEHEIDLCSQSHKCILLFHQRDKRHVKAKTLELCQPIH